MEALTHIKNELGSSNDTFLPLKRQKKNLKHKEKA
jgi:hypothetical protein